MRGRARQLVHALALLAPMSMAQLIPKTTVVSLAGNSIALPDALRGKVGVLVIGFSRGSQQEVTDWGRKLAADYHDSPAVLYYEMPMLASVPRLVRGLVIRQMRSSVPELAWPHFAPLTEEEKTWRTVTHYAADDDAYVLLVDGNGNVRWQTAGASTDAAYTTLKQQIGASTSQTGSPSQRP